MKKRAEFNTFLVVRTSWILLASLSLCHANPSEKVATHHTAHHKKQHHYNNSNNNNNNDNINIPWTTHRQINDSLLKQLDQYHQSLSVIITPTRSTTTTSHALKFLDVSTHLVDSSSTSSSRKNSRKRSSLLVEEHWTFQTVSRKENNKDQRVAANTEEVFPKSIQRRKHHQPINKQRQLYRKDDMMKTLWKRFVDDYNFKGYGISLYKSLLYLKTFGIAFRVPLINNWDWWDSNPSLPSLNLMVCMYYPFNLSMCLTSSINIEVIKCWMVQSLYMIQAGIYRFIHHMLSAVWTIMSLVLYPILQKWYPAPFHLDQTSQQIMEKRDGITPSYKSGIQERLGVSYWYKWAPVTGFTTRLSAWHIYMPTLELCGQLLMGSSTENNKLGQWWKSHFASVGLDTAIPNPMPPHVSLTGVLSVSGLLLNRKASRTNKKAHDSKRGSEEKEIEGSSIITVSPAAIAAVEDDLSILTSLSSGSSDRETTKAKLSSILHQEDIDEHEFLSKVGRGGNSTATTCGDSSGTTMTDQSNPEL
jgi:hypothetical protein